MQTEQMIVLWIILYFLCVFVSGLDCGIQDYIPTTVRPQFELACAAVRELSQTETVEDIDIHSIPYGKDILCTACTLTFEFLITSRKFYVPDQVIRKAMVTLCSFIQTRPVCQGIIDLNVPIFLEIANRKPDLRAEHICGTVLEQYCVTKPVVDWYIDIPDRTKYSEAKGVTLRSSKSVMEVAHVTDTHVDLKYAAGTRAVGCREPLCCRSYQLPSSTSAVTAGQWGSYKSCDVPTSTVHNLLETLYSRHQNIEYVYMTGDLIAHNLWETTREDNIKQIQDQAVLFRDILGKDVKIFPVLGNHEPHPANVLAPPTIKNYSGEWLYEAFYDAWCKDFPAEAKSTFMKGGYYTVTPTPGFRIIGLNSLFGYVFNWWMILDPEDPADQLKWLRETLLLAETRWMILDPEDPAGQLKWLGETLLLAETRQEKVHILMHGPSVETDTLQVWNREYNRIIERFQSTITGQFLGHTHRDQFYVYYSHTTHKPVSVAWNGGSVTPFTNVNPNYRIYTVNKQTLEVEDFDTYTYNLTEANQTPDTPPRWRKLYSFRQAYNVPSLKPRDIHLLAQKMSNDNQLFNKYFLYYMKNSDIAFAKGCDKKCRETHLCKVVTAPNNSTHCRHVLQYIDGSD